MNRFYRNREALFLSRPGRKSSRKNGSDDIRAGLLPAPRPGRIRGRGLGRCRRPAAESMGHTEDMRYFLGLGSNLGDPRKNLVRARRHLAGNGLKIRKASSLYLTEPVGFPGQPWFLNQVVQVETGLSPWELLGLVKLVETKMGRTPGSRNGPRVIDIDILLADGTVVDTSALSVPHPRLAERNFALVPLAEIAPRAVHPGLKKTVRALLRESPDRSRVEKASARPEPRSAAR